MTELSGYALSHLGEGPPTLFRGLGEGLAPILLARADGSSPGLLHRLEHEYAMRAELGGEWAVIPVELLRRGGGLTLVLADSGGEPLDHMLGRPMEVLDFLRIAVPLAAAVGRMHAQGLVHKDLKPANILVDPANSGVWLTGFGIASRLPRERQAPSPPEVIAGTLAYMAPEQTGRMNRSIDSRSDLYALGIIFYEMLTGGLPFIAADPMEWVHCHIARQPVPPGERIPGIPGVLSTIVLKLLAKTADDRYQTAVGLAIDLQRCLSAWQATGGIAPFPVGQRDVPDRLLLPERLYGREGEIDRLLATFDRVVAGGTPELVLVSGYSGIGKSSVVNEMHRSLVPSRGLFASGKFDQYKHDIPYATLAQAFGNLVRPLLGQSEAALGRWRTALNEALGPNGQLIVNLVPELELVIDKQPPVPDLPPQDAQNRFQMAFRRFLGVFARQEHPLALFLDDLQWLDTATLDLLEHLLTHSEVRHLMLIGAYRDNEVGPTHPLLRTLKAIRAGGGRVEEIVLAPLRLEDVSRLIADGLHSTPQSARPLARLVKEKTSGNPFFAIQFLTALAEEELLTFDRGTLAWQWDVDRIRAQNYTDNVVDLMVGKLRRLVPGTREAVQQLACLGNVAESATLALVRGEAEAATQAALWEAVHSGLVLPQDRAYKFPHDRIQQAAYSLIPDDRRADIHLRIGRALLAGMTADDLAEHLFDVANQFNRGTALLVDRDEKIRAAAINLRAGRKAKASAAYAAARSYFESGMALLDEEDSGSQYQLAFNLWLERSECAFLTGEFDKAEQLIATLLQRATSTVDLATIYQLKLQFHVMKSENQQAVASALECLRLFGIELPAHPSWEQVQLEYKMVWQTLDGRSIESLVDLPLMTDPELQAAMQLLSVLTPPAYFTDFHLFCLIACRMVTVGTQHGLSGAATLGYALLGFVLGPVFHRFGEGYRFAKLACDLVEKHGFVANPAKVYHAAGTVAFWTQSVETAINFMGAAYRAAIETGDLTFACYGMYQSVTGRLLLNDPLDAVWRESEAALDFARDARYGDAADIVRSQQRFIATMQGRTVTFSTFSDAQFDEARFEAQLAKDRMTLMTCFYWILKLKARFLSGDYADALAAAEKVKPLLSAAAAQIQLLDYYYYGALTVAALYGEASADEQSRWRELLAAHQEQLCEWAETYPPTFGDKHALVSAEIARLTGRVLDAERLYEDAIRQARANGFVQNEGLAQEVAARFYAARGLETISSALLRNARSCYSLWGAMGKVRQLETLHPGVFEDGMTRPSATALGTPIAQFDIGAAVKASQAVSGEIVLDRLIETLMTIALEHAGAERGLLILLRGDKLQIESEARSAHKTIEVALRRVEVTAAELPESLLHTVIRTRQSVILDDAAAQNPFAADAYFSRTRVRSLLCLPLVKQTKLLGVLYLENNLASYVFTPARISVLELLASQAAISLENAGLYAELQVSEDRWRNLFENVPVGVALVGKAGRYVAVNQALQRMTGYSEAELLRLSPVDITHEDDRASTAAIIAARAAGGPQTQVVEKRYRRKDGGTVWAELSTFVIPVGSGPPLYAGVAVDITARKRAVEELRRSEASLAQAQVISRTGSWRWTVGAEVLSTSAEFLRIFGFDPAAKQVSYNALLDRVDPEDRPLLEQNFAKATQDRRAFQREYRIILPDGAIRYLQSIGHPGLTDTGAPEFFGTVMDITERKLAEEALRNVQSDLARVSRLTTLGELAASLAHEINQPLVAITLNAASALRWLNRDQADLDEARIMLAQIERDGMRAGNVIQGLQAMVKKSGPHIAKFDISDAIDEVLTLTRSELHRRGVVLVTDLAGGDRPVLGDRVQLQQVLLNLIVNGIQAMEEVADRRRELHVTVTPAEPGHVRVAVGDTGPGLDPALAQHIFEPLFTTKPDGLGMGLSICRSIIEAHGGRLLSKPKLPRGIVFEFQLPTDSQEAP
ncbi:MAG TPA: AAA family ATPase [Acidisoma sp.]|uniref:AAA family ATPase n=1 Tax=Acidisoma sp. TaxID=1872115 RepID=UPI002B87B593|nr:AAA family ATPase [Acidisoma sp.]HTI01741.1 AAA family ATPase [Acidisoma sp.]